MHLIISIGSNISEYNVDKAIKWLGSIMSDIRVSSIYETPAVKGAGRPYSNAVVAGDVDTDAISFNTRLKDFELNCGRNEEARSRGDVPVDLDIVVCDSEIVRPWDFRQNFFRIGYSELAGSPVEK